MMKYVIFEKTEKNYSGGEDMIIYLPVLFPRHIVHSTITISSKYPVSSAGFFDPINRSACGRSDSLGVSSIPERDSIILNNAIQHPNNELKFYAKSSCYNVIPKNVEITLDMSNPYLSNKYEFNFFIDEIIKAGFNLKYTYPFGVITGTIENDTIYNKLCSFNEIINIKYEK